jgi:hypothetical protein
MRAFFAAFANHAVLKTRSAVQASLSKKVYHPVLPCVKAHVQEKRKYSNRGTRNGQPPFAPLLRRQQRQYARDY